MAIFVNDEVLSKGFLAKWYLLFTLETRKCTNYVWVLLEMVSVGPGIKTWRLPRPTRSRSRISCIDHCPMSSCRHCNIVTLKTWGARKHDCIFISKTEIKIDQETQSNIHDSLEHWIHYFVFDIFIMMIQQTIEELLKPLSVSQITRNTRPVTCHVCWQCPDCRNCRAAAFTPTPLIYPSCQ